MGQGSPSVASLSAKEGDPPPEVEQTRERGSHVCQRGGDEDAAGPLHVVRRQVITVLEDWKGTPEAGVPLDWKCEEVHKGRDPHRRHPGNEDEYACRRGSSQRCCDRNAYHDHRPELFRPLRETHKPCALRERLIARMVLNRMPDFVGGNR